MTTSKKNIALYTTHKAIVTATSAFSLSGQSVQNEAHKIACSVLAMLGKTGDVRPAGALVADLVKAMPEMGRVNALKDWFAKFGPINFGLDGKTVTHVKGKATLLGEAMNMPFWKFSPEKDYQPIDITKMLESLEKKIATDATKTGRNHAAVLKALKAIKVNDHVAKVSPKSAPAEIAKQKKLRTAKAAPKVALAA